MNKKQRKADKFNNALIVIELFKAYVIIDQMSSCMICSWYPNYA